MRTPLIRLVLLAVAIVGCGDDAGTTGGGGGGSGGGETAPLVLDVADGTLEGVLIGETRTFLGVPYAAPPVGDLRWKPPQPHGPWAEPLQAIARGAVCPQLSPLNGSLVDSSEDCLTLNVWAPAHPTSTKLPIFVWIHGGGYVFGSGGDAAYDGQRFSEATGGIVVTMNYRLGPLGFLGLASLADEDAALPTTGNYGLEDQRAAITWIRDNAAAFGGDPEHLLIFGESAGGASVCQHIVSPRSVGLFQAAVIESGPCDLVTTQVDAFAQGADFASAAGCTIDDLSCLRALPVETVMTAIPATDFTVTGGGRAWYPMIDGFELPVAPTEALASGDFTKVPTILGTNSDEGSLFFSLGGTMIETEAELEALAEGFSPGNGAVIVAEYAAPEYPTPQDAAIAAVGDAGFVCPTRRAARAFDAAGVPTYLYHFTYGPTSLFGDLGAFHSAEIKFVLGNPGQLLPTPLTEDELKLSNAIIGYWSRLGTSGDPNGADALAWPAYASATDQSLRLDLELSVESGLRKDRCDFWDALEP